MLYFLATLPNLGACYRPQIRLAAVILALCVFASSTQRPALGQAQLAAAETCFDQEQSFAPAVHSTPAPQVQNSLPYRLSQLEVFFRPRPANSQPAKAATAPGEVTRARNRLVAESKNSEGPLTALR
jgi:hypothetical protein